MCIPFVHTNGTFGRARYDLRVNPSSSLCARYECFLLESHIIVGLGFTSYPSPPAESKKEAFHSAAYLWHMRAGFHFVHPSFWQPFVSSIISPLSHPRESKKKIKHISVERRAHSLYLLETLAKRMHLYPYNGKSTRTSIVADTDWNKKRGKRETPRWGKAVTSIQEDHGVDVIWQNHHRRVIIESSTHPKNLACPDPNRIREVRWERGVLCNSDLFPRPTSPTPAYIRDTG